MTKKRDHKKPVVRFKQRITTERNKIQKEIEKHLESQKEQNSKI